MKIVAPFSDREKKYAFHYLVFGRAQWVSAHSPSTEEHIGLIFLFQNVNKKFQSPFPSISGYSGRPKWRHKRFLWIAISWNWDSSKIA